MVYESENKTSERHPVRRGKYKVHKDKPTQRARLQEQTQEEIDQEEQDQAVDEAVDESFPASDPPSWSPTTTGGTGQNRNH
jgi:hypothetical protein